jgi:trimethylamine-N-oxide reductase (cytochrome c)
MVLLQAMQGLGKPGVGMWGNGNGAPASWDIFFPGYADLDGMMSYTRAAKTKVDNPVKQRYTGYF